MSLANLLEPNNYNIFLRSLDVEEISIQGKPLKEYLDQLPDSSLGSKPIQTQLEIIKGDIRQIKQLLADIHATIFQNQ